MTERQLKDAIERSRNRAIALELFDKASALFDASYSYTDTYTRNATEAMQRRLKELNLRQLRQMDAAEAEIKAAVHVEYHSEGK